MYKLLIVEDEPDVLRYLKAFFESKNFEVFTANSGEEAIQIVKQARPHIVLLDIIMPGMGGIAALKEIKQIDPAIGVIMATAVYDEETARETIEAGAYDYVTKPFDFQYLETTVLIKLMKMLG